MKKLIILICILSGINLSQAASLSDRDKEQRWREQILSSLMLGRDIELRAGGVKFLALYSAAQTRTRKGAVILVHGRGAHPAWPDVIEPLRISLADQGWDTLSLQMPVLANQAEDRDYIPLMPEVPLRIQAGVDYLKSRGVRKIVLSGHSTGATMVSYYLANSMDPAVQGFMIISGGPGVAGAVRMDSLKNFTRLKNLKILDVYGGEDRKEIFRAEADRRKQAEKNHANRYQSIQIKGAGHFYRGKEDILRDRLGKWLNENI